jgi:hypothetical protein
MFQRHFQIMIPFNFIGSWWRALVLERRPCGAYSLRRAVCATLLLTAVGWSGSLAGCSGIAAPNEELAPTAPDPSFRDVIATHLKGTLKNHSTYQAFEISDPRWVHTMKGWNWLTCVRFQDSGRLRTYTVFLSDNKVIDSRYAVLTDNCDTQTYYQFERMYGGLDPLH